MCEDRNLNFVWDNLNQPFLEKSLLKPRHNITILAEFCIAGSVPTFSSLWSACCSGMKTQWHGNAFRITVFKGNPPITHRYIADALRGKFLSISFLLKFSVGAYWRITFHLPLANSEVLYKVLNKSDVSQVVFDLNMSVCLFSKAYLHLFKIIAIHSGWNSDKNVALPSTLSSKMLSFKSNGSDFRSR